MSLNDYLANDIRTYKDIENLLSDKEDVKEEVVYFEIERI